MSHSDQLIFGIHAVEALLKNEPGRVLRLCVHQDRQDKKIESIVQLAKSNGIRVEFSKRAELDHLTHDANHQGVLAYCKPAKVLSEADLKSILVKLDTAPLLLILDGIQDPHNLGACFRTADAAGVHAIIAPRDRSVGITSTVTKVACGAAESVPFIQVTNLARAIEHIKELGIWVYGAAGEAKDTIYQTDFKGPTAIAMGAEGEGLRRLTRELCDGLVKIPMFGSVSSLNVSVATGVCLFEVARQRIKS